MKKKKRGSSVQVALLVVQVNFAVGAIVAKVGMARVDPLRFALARDVCAGMALLVLSRAYRVAPSREFFVVGLCVFLAQVLAIVGLKFGRAVDFAAWQPTQPAMTAAASVLLGRERFDFNRALGILLSFLGIAGVALLSTTAQKDDDDDDDDQSPNNNNKEEDSSSPFFVKGQKKKTTTANVCFALASVAGAAMQLTSKEVLAKGHAPFVVAGWSYSTAALFTAGLAVVVPSNALCADCDDDFFFPLTAVPALLWWICMSTVVNYALILWAIKESTPTLVTSFTGLQPVLTAMLTAILRLVFPRRFDLDPTPPADFAAFALVIAGLALVVGAETRVVVDKENLEKKKIAIDDSSALSSSSSSSSSEKKRTAAASSADDHDALLEGHES